MLAGNLNSRAVKYMQASRITRITYHASRITYHVSCVYHVTRIPRAHRVLAGSSCYAYHLNPTFSRKVQVTLPLSFCHVVKRPKDIESDMLSGGLVYLFRTLEIYKLEYK